MIRTRVFRRAGAARDGADELAGHFGGIGAYMTRNEAGDLVLTVIPDRPAAKAGVQDGDVLLEVDGKPITQEMKVDEVVALVRGDIGTKVTLKLQRSGQAEPLIVSVVRERIETPSVEWRVLDTDKHIGYARISLFGQRTSQELEAGLADLASQGVDKLVLDLRGNGGGLVDAAVDIAQPVYQGRPGAPGSEAWGARALLPDQGCERSGPGLGACPPGRWRHRQRLRNRRRLAA